MKMVPHHAYKYTSLQARIHSLSKDFLLSFNFGNGTIASLSAFLRRESVSICSSLYNLLPSSACFHACQYCASVEFVCTYKDVEYHYLILHWLETPKHQSMLAHSQLFHNKLCTFQDCKSDGFTHATRQKLVARC